MSEPKTHDERSGERGHKRKKKRSHIQMAKKFARRRNHGTDVDNETYQYMIRVLEMVRGDFPTLEEKALFVRNVYEETVGHELEYARNQVGSRMLDSLLEYANIGAIERLVDAFSGSLRQVSTDRFASHVLQKIIAVCADRGNRRESSIGVDGDAGAAAEENGRSAGWAVGVEESDIEKYNRIVVKLCKYLLNNVEEFVYDTYANHLLRTSLECLSGLVSETKAESDKRRGSEADSASALLARRRVVGEEYKTVLGESCARIRKWAQFHEFGKDELTCGLLQSLLHSTWVADQAECEACVLKIIDECFQFEESKDGVPGIFESAPSLRLLETCLMLASPTVFTKIYNKFFAGHLAALSAKAAANYSVQRLLNYCPAKSDFEEMYEELSAAHLAEILNGGHVGVLSSLSGACLRLQSKQGAFLKDCAALFQGDRGPESDRASDLARNLISLKECAGKKGAPELERRTQAGEKDAEWGAGSRTRQCKKPASFVNFHGSLIVQNILKFNKPIKLVNSLLEMTSEELVDLFSDPKGSHVADAFIESNYIGEKSREKLAKKLKGSWSLLATGTHSSRSFEKFWTWARINQKLLIMDELSQAGEALHATKSGRIISNKLNVQSFTRNKKDWQDALDKQERTKALFASITGETKK